MEKSVGKYQLDSVELNLGDDDRVVLLVVLAADRLPVHFVEGPGDVRLAIVTLGHFLIFFNETSSSLANGTSS